MSELENNAVDESQWCPKKLFVGGLCNSTTNDSLKTFFEQWGDIVDAVVVKDSMTGRSRGFGFVTYATLLMADCALNNRPHVIDGRLVETKDAVPQNNIDNLNIARNAKTIFVSGIDEETEEKLTEYFGKYGKILNIKIITDKETGQRKGFGFIEYDDEDSVDNAVFTKYHNVFGSYLVVKRAVYKIRASTFRGQRGRSCYGSGGIMNSGGSNYHFTDYLYDPYGNSAGWIQVQGDHQAMNYFGYWPQGGFFQGWKNNEQASYVNFQSSRGIRGRKWRDNHSSYNARVPMWRAITTIPTFSLP